MKVFLISRVSINPINNPNRRKYQTMSTEKELTKTFEDLITEVHDAGLCGLCGGCVSFCTAAKIGAIKLQENAPPVFANKDKCLKCGICYLICPQTRILNSELHKKYDYKPPIGNWRAFTSAQANDPEIRAVATDGGVVTALLVYLLDNHLIDGALVIKTTDLLIPEAFLARNRDELLAAAGSRFDIQAMTAHLGKYTTFRPVISGFKQLVTSDRMNIAIVGVPCQIHSIRKMQDLKILPSHVIKYVFGLFCNKNFTFTEENQRKIEEKYKFSFNDILKIYIKEDVIFYLRDKRNIHFSMDDIDEFVRPACIACDDFSNVYADISFGGLGSKENFTTSVIRTSVGSEIYNDALVKGYIKEFEVDNTPLLKSKMISKVRNYAEWKMKRANEKLKHVGRN